MRVCILGRLSGMAGGMGMTTVETSRGREQQGGGSRVGLESHGVGVGVERRVGTGLCVGHHSGRSTGRSSRRRSQSEVVEGATTTMMVVVVADVSKQMKMMVEETKATMGRPTLVQETSKVGCLKTARQPAARWSKSYCRPVPRLPGSRSVLAPMASVSALGTLQLPAAKMRGPRSAVRYATLLPCASLLRRVRSRARLARRLQSWHRSGHLPFARPV